MKSLLNQALRNNKHLLVVFMLFLFAGILCISTEKVEADEYPGAHDNHEGWTVLTTDGIYIRYGGTYNYYLESDVELSEYIYFDTNESATINICLNGHTLTLYNPATNTHATSGTINFIDCSTPDSRGTIVLKVLESIYSYDFFYAQCNMNFSNINIRTEGSNMGRTPDLFYLMSPGICLSMNNVDVEYSFGDLCTHTNLPAVISLKDSHIRTSSGCFAMDTTDHAVIDNCIIESTNTEPENWSVAITLWYGGKISLINGTQIKGFYCPLYFGGASIVIGSDVTFGDGSACLYYMGEGIDEDHHTTLKDSTNNQYKIMASLDPSNGYNEIKIFEDMSSELFARMSLDDSLKDQYYMAMEDDCVYFGTCYIVNHPTPESPTVTVTGRGTPSYQWYNATINKTVYTDSNSIMSFTLYSSTVTASYDSVNKIWHNSYDESDDDYYYTKISLNAGDTVKFTLYSPSGPWEEGYVCGYNPETGNGFGTDTFDTGSVVDGKIVVECTVPKTDTYTISGYIWDDEYNNYDADCAIEKYTTIVNDPIANETSATLSTDEDGIYVCKVNWTENGNLLMSTYSKAIEIENSNSDPDPGYDPDPTPTPNPGPALLPILYQDSDPEDTTQSTKPDEYTIPVKGEDTVQVEAEISDGNADIKEITPDDIDAIFKKYSEEQSDAEEGYSGESTSDATRIIVDLSEAEQNVDSVTLTKESVETIADAVTNETISAQSLEIKLTNATIILDDKAIVAVSEQAEGDEIRLVVKDSTIDSLNTVQQEVLKGIGVSAVIDAHIESNGVEIHDFKGGLVEIAFEFDLEPGRNAKHYFVRYVAVDGTTENYPTSFAKGVIRFVTGHLSDYVIVYDETEDNNTGKPLLPVTDGKAEIPATVPYLKMTKVIGLGNKFAFCVTNISEDAEITYASSDESIATVDENGIITAVGIGKCNIIGLVKQNGTVYKFVIVAKVRDTNSKNIQTKESASLTPNSEQPLLNVYKAVRKTKPVKLDVCGISEDAEVWYVSEDETTAVVSEDGYVTGLKTGYAGINVYVRQNGQTYQYRVIVRVTAK